MRPISSPTSAKELCESPAAGMLCVHMTGVLPTWLAAAGHNLSFTLSKASTTFALPQEASREEYSDDVFVRAKRKRVLGAGDLQVCVMWGRPDLRKI